MTWIILGALLIAWILVVLIPLINRILTEETITIINNMLDNLEFFIWSENLTVFLCLILVIIIIIITRFITKFFHVNNE